MKIFGIEFITRANLPRGTELHLHPIVVFSGGVHPGKFDDGNYLISIEAHWPIRLVPEGFNVSRLYLSEYTFDVVWRREVLSISIRLPDIKLFRHSE